MLNIQKVGKEQSNEGSEWQESLNIYNAAIIFLLSEQSSFRDVSCMLVSDQNIWASNQSSQLRARYWRRKGYICVSE